MQAAIRCRHPTFRNRGGAQQHSIADGLLGVQANFPMNPRFLRELEPQTDAIDDADRSELIAGYSCPAGSVVFFSECGAIST